METTGLHMDCHITATSQEDIDRELAAIRTRAYAALGVKPAATTSSSTRRRTVRGQTRPARVRKPAPRQSRPRARATSNGPVTDEQLQAAMKGAGGMDAKAIAGKVGLSQNTVLRRLHKLEQAGGVSRQGERSQTRWFAREPVAA